MRKLENWLTDLGVSELLDVFKQNDVNFELLEELDDADLKEMGLSLGHRRKLIKEIRNLHLSVDDSAVSKLPLTPPDSENGLGSSGYSAEKRFMTLMFCDLADSTKIASLLDIEENHEINRAYQQKCTEVINYYGGYVAKYMGDGILAYFGFPAAKEDDAGRSVHAGLAIVKAIDALNDRFQIEGDIKLAARVGIATGPVVIEPIGEGKSFENAVVGEAPNLAARMEAHAGLGEVMIGPDTHKLVENAFEFIDCGKKSVKGYDQSIQTWRVVKGRTVEESQALKSGKHLTRMFGRDEELDLLKSRWQRSLAGDGQVVLLSGEAGVGKSRMIEELLTSVTEFHQCMRFFCQENYAQSPLFPVISNLFKEAGVSGLHSAEEKSAKLAQLLTAFYVWEPELVNTMLSLAVPDSDLGHQEEVADPAYALQLLQQKLADTIVVKSEDTPILLIIEDAHWIDASSHKLLDLLINQIQEKRILLIISYRHETPVQYAGSNVTNLSLTTLTRKHADSLAREIAMNSGLSDETIRQISNKSDGVPLYIEEIAKTLVDDKESGGSIDSDGYSVPDTLQASMMAKLDQLGDARILAQCGAVIGNTFEVEIALHIAELTKGVLETALEKLVSNRITVRDSQGASQALRFRHALLREAAYGSLLKKNRVMLHSKIAEYLESSYGSDNGSIRQILAHHYELSNQWDNAFLSWLSAGDTALRSGATTESVELLDKASALVDKVTDDKVDKQDLYRFQMCRGKALNASKGAISQAAHEAFSDAAEIAVSLNNIEQQVDALDYLFGITFNAGNIQSSIEHANRMLEIGAEFGNKIATVSGYQGLGMAHCTLGQFDEASKYLQAALDFEDNRIEGINCYPSMTLDYLSYVKCIVGDQEAAKLLCSRALESAKTESAYAAATALNNTCFTEMMLGNHERVKELSDQGLALAEESGQFMLLNRARLFNNLSRGWLEKNADCLADVVESTSSLFSANEVIDLTYLIGMTAELQVFLGQYDEALESIEQAISISNKTQENFYRVELLRLKAEAIRYIERGNDEDSRENLQENSEDVLKQAAALGDEQQSYGWLVRINKTREQWCRDS